jgi:hypothetical protein
MESRSEDTKNLGTVPYDQENEEPGGHQCVSS